MHAYFSKFPWSTRLPALRRCRESLFLLEADRKSDSTTRFLSRCHRTLKSPSRRGHSDDRGTREARVHSYMRVGCLLLIHLDALFSEENGLENYFLECWWCDSLNGVY